MALAWVGQAYDAGVTTGTSHTQAFSPNPTAGNFLGACLRWNSNTVTISTIADTPTNTWVDSGNGTTDIGTTLREQVHYVANNSTTGADTTTWTTSASTSSRRGVFEVSGHNTASPINGFNEGSGTTTGAAETITGPSVTPTAGSVIVVGVFGTNSNNNFVAAGSYNLAGSPTGRVAFVYQIVTADGSTAYTPQVTLSVASGETWIGQTVVINAAAAAAAAKQLAALGVG